MQKSTASPRWARARALRVLIGLVLLATLSAPGAAAAPMNSVSAQTPGPGAEYDLRVGGRQALPGGAVVVRGAARLAVTPSAGIARVRFYLDPSAEELENPTLAGTPFATVEQAPFELNAGSGPGSDRLTLPEGPQQILAAIDLTDGRTVIKTARLLVHNGSPALFFGNDALRLVLPQGGRLERALSLLPSDGRGANYSLSADASWLRFESDTPFGPAEKGSAPGRHIVEVDAGGLAPGQYTASVTATADGLAPATTAVTMTVLAPTANCAPLDCSQVKVVAPYVLSFSDNHGGLVDANGVGTGFTWVDKPTAGGTGYIPANLFSDLAAGALKITTTGSIAYLANNNQDNTLGVGIDAADQVSVLDTTLENLPAMTGNYEQAGLWYGTDDNNYLKLVLVSEPGAVRVQFMEERNGLQQQAVVSGPVSVAGATVQLRMRADPVAKSVTGYYSLNGGAMSELSKFTVPAELFNADGAGIDPALGTRVFGGVFATDRNLQGTAIFQFADFSLTSGGNPSQPGSMSWDRVSFPFSYPSSLVLGRDGRLYATETWGNIRAIRLDENLAVVANDVIHTLNGRLVLGITEDPASTPDQIILWVAHSDGSMDQFGHFTGAVNSGIVSRFVGPGFAREDIITGLPRALANHSTNSLHFGPDGKLYIAQGGNTGAGAPNESATEFGTRAEQPLSAALLVADVKAPGFDGSCATPEGSFPPSPCSVTTFATGMRNMYDFTFHSNGAIYGPDNGLGVDGTYPPSPTSPCTGLANPATNDPGAQPDLFHCIEQGKYYGHPNPYRNECVFKNGALQGVAPAANYVAPLLDLGMNKSANGIVEYTAPAFDGLLQGNLLITNYSVGDDIVRIKLSANGQSVELAESIIGGFNDPLPLHAGPDGRLYVGEHGSSGSTGKITILTPKPIGHWTTKAPLPVNLVDAGGTAVNGKLYVVAGKDGVGPKKNMYIYDPVANTWATGAPLPNNYPAVENPAAVAYNGKLYLFGGSTQAFAGAVSNAAVYNPAITTWTDLAPLATARGGATAQVVGSKIYVAGGMDGTGASLNSVEVYDPATNTWAPVPAMSVARDNPGSAVFAGKLYVFGGRTRSSTGAEISPTLSSMEMFDPATNTWTARAPMPTGRRTFVVGTLNGRAQAIGGEKNPATTAGTFGANEEYDPLTDSWRLLTPVPTPRHGAAGGTINGVVYMVSGGPMTGMSTSNVNEAFSFGSAACTPVSAGIHIVGGKVQLTWSGADPAGYEVHRADLPYFTLAAPFATNATSPWTDSAANVGNPNLNYTYLVRVTGCTAIDGPRVAEFDFTLTPGQ